MALTLSQMQALVQQICGDTNGVQFPAATVTSFLNFGQIEIARKTEWNIKTVTTTTLNADKTYTLPDDYLQVKSLKWDGQPIWPMNPEYLKRKVINTGVPYSYYAWAGEFLKFYPEPSAITGLNISLDYVATPVDLAAGGDISQLPTRYMEDLIQYAVMRCKQMDEDMTAMDSIANNIERRLGQAVFEKEVQDNDGFFQITDCDSDLNSHGNSWLS